MVRDGMIVSVFLGFRMFGVESSWIRMGVLFLQGFSGAGRWRVLLMV